MSSKLIELHQAGFSYREIADKLQMAKSTVSYHVKKWRSGKPLCPEAANRYDWSAIQAFYDADATRNTKSISAAFGVTTDSITKAVARGDLRLRPTIVQSIINGTYTGKYNRYKLKERLIKDGVFEHVCAECGLQPEWNGKKLTLALDHINGVNDHNRLENLRLLCPNCHSQTETFAGRNIKRRCG